MPRRPGESPSSVCKGKRVLEDEGAGWSRSGAVCVVVGVREGQEGRPFEILNQVPWALSLPFLLVKK